MNQNILGQKYLIITLIQGFPPEYYEDVFTDTMSIEEFADAVILEFIRYAYSKSEKKHSLRYYYLSDLYSPIDEDSFRMIYSRVMGYVQGKRDMEYPEEKELFGAGAEKLIGKDMSPMENKIEGYEITPTNYYELTKVRELPIVKSLLEHRLTNTKSVSNNVFRYYMAEYDDFVEELQCQNNDENDIVFFTLNFFTFQWKYPIEMVFSAAKRMEELKIKSIPPNALDIYCLDGEIYSRAVGDVRTVNRMIKERQLMISKAIDGQTELSENCRLCITRYNEILALSAWLYDLKRENGKFLRDEFAESTSLKDWAEFCTEYNLFSIWHRKDGKELTNAVIHNMRYLFDSLFAK